MYLRLSSEGQPGEREKEKTWIRKKVMFDWNEFVFGRVGGHHVAVVAAIDSSLPLFIVSCSQHMAAYM